MDTLQHDSLTKQQVKDALYEFLYTPSGNRLQERLNTLIIRNMQLAGYTHKSFYYKGVCYSCDDAPPPKRWNKLLPQLKEQMEDYLRDMEQINRYELPFVIGYINQALNASNNFGDYLRLFPDCLHPPLQKLIATCPCSTAALSDDKVEKIIDKNRVPINMIKQRMLTNLII